MITLFIPPLKHSSLIDFPPRSRQYLQQTNLNNKQEKGMRPVSTVLCIGDSLDQFDVWDQELGEYFTLLSANSLEEAKELFSAHQASLCAIISGGLVRGEPTPPLIRFFRDSGFKEAIIALSEDRHLQRELMSTGCDSIAPSQAYVPALIWDAWTHVRRRDLYDMEASTVPHHH